MKNLTYLLLLSSLSAMAVCENTELKIQANISENDFDQSYDQEKVDLSLDKSEVQITIKSNGEPIILKDIFFENDGAGNFTLTSKSLSKNLSLYLDHDHEVWHTDGLSGGFTSSEGIDYSFENIKNCSFDDLFIIK